MSFLEDFNNQWNTVTNRIGNAVDSRAKLGTVNADDLQKLLDNEKQRYTLPTEYQYAWLEKLRREKPEVAEAFESRLQAAALQPVVQQPASFSGSNALMPTLALIGAVAGFAITRLLHMGIVPSVLGILLLGGGSSMAGAAISGQKKENADASLRDAYVRQMKEIGDSLQEIIIRADQSDE